MAYNRTMFNRTFLHFLVGFCLLVLLGMAGIVGANYLGMAQGQDASAQDAPSQ